MTVSLKKYEAFVKTVEMGNLTKAADVLGYTQSGMSHMLSSLESELGFTVLLRGRSGVKLTAAGEQLLPKIREILEKKKEIDELAAYIAGDSVGAVRVGAFTSVAVNWLPGIIKDYQKTHPAVEIKMYNGDYHDVEKWLENGDIDVGFIAMPGPAGVKCVPLKEDPLMVVLPEGHPLEQFSVVPIELAAGEPIISLLKSSAQDVYRALDRAGVKPDIRYTTKDDYAIIAMVRAGLGISIMPELLLKGNDSGVVLRRLSPDASRTIALGSPEARQHIPAVESFAECVVQWVNRNTAEEK